MNLEKVRWTENVGTLTLTIANPPVNLITEKVIQEFHMALEKAEKDQAIHAIALQGEGKYFSAGADIKEMAKFILAQDLSVEARRDRARDFSRRGHELILRISHLAEKKRVTALINGDAFGGGFEIALACSRLLVAESARVGLPEVTLGIMPGWGGTQLLPRRIAWERAMFLITTGRILSPSDMSSFFVIKELGSNLGQRPSPMPVKKVSPDAALHVLYLMDRRYGIRTLEQGLVEEREAFANLCVLPSAQEGIRAFLEKREPNFSFCEE